MTFDWQLHTSLSPDSLKLFDAFGRDKKKKYPKMGLSARDWDEGREKELSPQTWAFLTLLELHVHDCPLESQESVGI